MDRQKDTQMELIKGKGAGTDNIISKGFVLISWNPVYKEIPVFINFEVEV